MGSDRSGTVVVGVDGSAASVCALLAGLRDACSRGLSVELVTAWSWRDPGHHDGGFVLSRAARRRALRAQSAVAARAARVGGAQPPVTGVIVEGRPADVLVRAAEGAALLVLGATEHPGGEERSQPSVREECVRSAACPVLVVPESPLPSAPTSYDELHTNLVDVPPRGVSHVGP
jgi:nucleotide-binding universal stress UspA family protein